MQAIIEFFLRKSIFGNTLSLLLIGWGSYVAFTINREAFPPIDFDVVVITTVFPGASPEEVEKLITNPIEDQIKGIEGIKEIRSSSIENRSGINVIIDPDAKNPRKVIEDIRSAIDRVNTLPKDVEKPLIIEVSSRQIPVIEVNLLADENEVSYKTLREYAEILEADLKTIDSVANVSRRGWQDLEYVIKLDPKKIQENYISIEQILLSLQQRNINFPGGEVIVNGMSQIVRTIGEFTSISDIENFIIRSNELGQGVRIKDISRVEEDFEKEPYIYRTNGKIAITLIVAKKEQGDIIDTVARVQEKVQNFKKLLPNNIQVEIQNDVSFYVKRRLNILINNALTGLFLVVVSLFFFLGWRTAIMVALGIPIALGTAFISFKFLGVTLNLISMVGMIIVIGILVDDAIVVSENFYRYLEQGKSSFEAAVKGTSEVIAPVFASVITTIVSFAPLMFMSGIFGKFVYYIPLVVILTLLASLFEAFFILPGHLYDINKFSKSTKEIKGESNRFYQFRKNIYEPALKWVLKHKWISLGATVGFLIFSFVLQITVGKFKLFTGAVEAFFIKMKADPSTPLEEMDKFNQYISKVIESLPKEEIENYRTAAGISQQNPTDPFTKRGTNYAMALVYLTPEGKRKRSGEEIIRQIREETAWLINPKFLEGMEIFNPHQKFEPKIFPEFENLKGKLETLQIDLLRGGPPVGRPVAVEIVGKDYKILEQIGEEFKERIKKIDGVKNVDDDFELGKYEIRVKIDERAASIANVSVESISLVINAAFMGVVPTTIKKGTEEISIRVRYDDQYHKSIDTLYSLYVMNRLGQLIPVKKLIRIEKKQGVVAYNHLNGERLLTVLADIDEKRTTSAEVNQQIRKFMNEIIEKYPGYTVRLGGENKDTEESLKSLQRAFLIGFVINFMILSSLFGSILLPFITLITIPFALSGIFISFVLHQQPLSFLALVGFVGVAGVVVNSGIVMIDFAEKLRKNNPELSLEQVTIEAASLRLRPIILTTLTTVLGLLPTAYGIGGKDPFLVPLSLALAWGLLFSTLLTLFIIPLLFYKFSSFREWFKLRFQPR
ncbi:MAG: efflux RND transporter permease subunit [Leptospiraceae bacterium]|nr:efflux RND transporter permease subunit [Leptospiraceae bacterium]MDW7976915.1 efflux RND transporter permease subunit [Leptospiraceae bacterium]